MPGKLPAERRLHAGFFIGPQRPHGALKAGHGQSDKLITKLKQTVSLQKETVCFFVLRDFYLIGSISNMEEGQ